MGKLIENIVSVHLTAFSNEHNLLPETQFGGKCTTKALQCLLNITFTAWLAGKIVTIMALDMSGAYDNVNRQKLIEILRDKGVPPWIIHFVESFLSDGSTILHMPGLVTSKFPLGIGIPQGSPVSPILFLLFTTPLLAEAEKARDGKVNVHSFAFVDDMYLISESRSIRLNCNFLERVHNKILNILFGPHKYHVMHCKRPRSQVPRIPEDDWKLLPNIEGLNREKEPCQQLKLLGVIVDCALNWQAHISHIKGKVSQRLGYLTKVSDSTWGPDLDTMLRLYSTTVRPIITYACPAWFIFDPNNKPHWALAKTQIEKLEKLQQRCLRQLSDALSCTTGPVLEKEFHIESMENLLDRLASNHRAKNYSCPEHLAQQTMRNAVWSTDLGKHPYNALDRRTGDLLIHGALNLEIQLKRERENAERRGRGNEKKKGYKASDLIGAVRSLTREISDQRCAQRWREYLDDRFRRKILTDAQNQKLPQALTEEWGKQSLGYYSGLSRAQSTMLIYCRTEFIELSCHLSKISVRFPLQWFTLDDPI